MSADIENIHTIRKREAVEQGDLELRFDEATILIPLRFQRYVESLQSHIAVLEERIQKLEVGSPQILNINDKTAEILIVDLIRRRQSNGQTSIDVLDILTELSLPYQQINKILEKLKTRGLKEDD